MTNDNDEILDLTPEDHILTDLLTLVTILIVIGAICVYIAPGITELGNNIIPTRHTPLRESSDTPVMNDSLIIEFPDTPKPTEIESLISELTWANPADKAQYAHHPDKADDVHVCANMAVEQAEWILENYDYDVGIVMLHNRYLGDNHIQTWVDVNGTRYVIDSTSNYYWDEEGHVSQWKAQYGIQYTNVEKGREHVKENNEMLNNKDEPHSECSGGNGCPRSLRADIPESIVKPEIECKNDVVFVMDISASTFSEIVVDTGVTFLDYEKALMIDILDDKDFKDDRVGMVAFGGKAYEVSGLTYLGNDAARESLKETIMTIEPKGEITTTLDQGLAMAEEMLSNSVGSKDVIIISDGNIDMDIYESSRSVAARMNTADTRMHFIHVMSSPCDMVSEFRTIANDVGDSYQQTEYPYTIYPYLVI